MMKDDEREVQRKGRGRALATLCHIRHCFRILKCNNAMDEDAAMERNLLNSRLILMEKLSDPTLQFKHADVCGKKCFG